MHGLCHIEVGRPVDGDAGSGLNVSLSSPDGYLSQFRRLAEEAPSPRSRGMRHDAASASA